MTPREMCNIMSRRAVLLHVLALGALLGLRGTCDASIADHPDIIKPISLGDSSSMTNDTSIYDFHNISSILPQQKARIVGGSTVEVGAYPFIAQWYVSKTTRDLDTRDLRKSNIVLSFSIC